METVKVDLLVIGDIMCRTYATCYGNYGLVTAANQVDMSKEIPDGVIICGTRYDLTSAIVVETISGQIDVEAILAPEGKVVLASGCITLKPLR